MSHEMQILTTAGARSSTGERAAAIVPVARIPIHVRIATMADLPFMDGLQKKHSKALGYFPTKQFEGYIEMGAVLVAEEELKREDVKREADEPFSRFTSSRFTRPLGYIISRDRYLKRDELGVIFQLCVEPGVQRKLIGAALVQAAFDRSAYGCRLYCCWCAQDLEANYFWESMGFVPIAFRAGSGKKKRVHIFWQKRIVQGDTETKWWYPSQTSSGAIREDRLVFPIPPGVHWTDVQAVVLPGMEKKMIESVSSKQFHNPKSDIQNAAPAPAPQPAPQARRPRQFVQFGPPPAAAPAHVEQATVVFSSAPQKNPRKKKPAAKVDPKLVAAARELRDRALEHINTPGMGAEAGAGAGAGAEALPAGQGKYVVAKQIAQNMSFQPRRLPKAA